VVRAINNLLEAASRHCDIQRVVMTSSAITALFPEPNKEGIVVHEGERPLHREGNGRTLADDRSRFLE
jgi:nucleoside-diphosphate-sugar epimerase